MFVARLDFISTYASLLQCCEMTSSNKVESGSNAGSNGVRNEIMEDDGVYVVSVKIQLHIGGPSKTVNSEVLNALENIGTRQT